MNIKNVAQTPISQEIMEQIIAPINKQILIEEITHLPESDLLATRKKFEVYLSKPENIPNLLREIGRLRETTFRAVGEGTGKALDLDEYDEHFSNLFIWDKANQKIVGGYRVGFGKEIYKNLGLEGLYINSLFDIDKKAIPILKKSIELRRSYIVEEYQKSPWALFLLWQGILIFWLRNREHRYLIGPVSISKYYSHISKSLIVAFAKKFFLRDDWAPHFKPKTPFAPNLEDINLEDIAGNSIKDLEKFLLSIEPPHLKVPTMIKQYVKLNARFLSFNLDPNFSDALDGLMILNLDDVPDSIIQLLQEK